MKIVFLITLICGVVEECVSSINTIQDLIRLNKSPDLRPFKKALGYYEDTYLNSTELATKYDFLSEEHTVVTEDGYILTIFRILSKCNEVKKYPIVMMHGVLANSDAWILAGPKKGIGFILSRNCFDVWLTNHRGNSYSRKHKSLDPDRDKEFWNYSFEEIGYYDVPAIIDYVLMITNKTKIFYIGHSQGSTDFFVMGSMRPEYNDKIQLAIQLAPVAFMKHIRNPIIILAVKYLNEISTIINKAEIHELVAKNEYLPHELVEFLCQVLPELVCGTINYISVGGSTIRPKLLAVIYGHFPDGVSTKTLEHFGQIVKSHKFQRFDYGEQNLEKYGSSKPPRYNLTRITTPIVLIGAANDWLSDLKDVQTLESMLPNILETYIVPNPTWSHNDHIWGINAMKLIFNKILKYLEDFSNK